MSFEATMHVGGVRGEGRRTLELRTAILAMLPELPAAVSSRQVFYQCVSRGVIENNAKSCRAVLRLLVKMRRDCSIPYSRIVDRTRRKHHEQGWDGVTEIMEAVAGQYRRDLWSDQPVIPMIACEKQALEGIFSKIVDEYGASLWTIRGFNSESFEFEWSEEIRNLTVGGKRVAIAYFGDFDPSGLAIEENSRRKLTGFGAVFSWRRGGLSQEDFDALDLVRVPVKRTDTRAKSFLTQFGDCAAELDALHPAELERRIRVAIEEHIDTAKWDRLRAVELVERDSLHVVTRNWDTAVQAAREIA
jgi:hypothetical protein